MVVSTTKTPAHVFGGNPSDSRYSPDPNEVADLIEEIRLGAAGSAEIGEFDSRLGAMEARDGTAPNPKDAVACATTANITLSGEQTIDGVTTSSDRILVKDQSNSAENGIYVTGAGAWSRATDMDADAEVDFASVYVLSGTANGNTAWQTTASAVTLDDDDLIWVQVDAGTDQVATEEQARTAASTSQLVPTDLVVAAVESLLTRSSRVRAVLADFWRSSGGGGAVVQDAAGKELLGFDADGRARVSEGLELHKWTYDYNTHLLHFLRTGTGSTYPLVLAVSAVTGLLRLGRIDRISRRTNRLGRGWGANMETAQLAITLGYGQSLAVGGGQDYADVAAAGSLPVIHHPLSARMVMLNTGMNGIEGTALSASAVTDLVQAQEEWELPRGLGQTQGSGLMLQAEYLQRERGVLDHQLYHTFGRGGRAIADLAQGETCYANGITAFTRAVALAAEYDLDPVLRGVAFSQGEQDRSDGTAQATYKAALIQLQSDLDTDLQAVLARAAPYRLYVDQLAATSSESAVSGNSGASVVALAQLEADAEDNIILTGPGYQYARLDAVHPIAKSYDLMGERHAHVMHQVEVLGVDWHPLKPTSIVRTGTTITLTMNVPNGDLVFDTDTLSEAADYGFTYSGANITDVTITDATAGTIEITIDADAGGDLAYAYDGPGAAQANGVYPHAGAWGNLRDGDGAEVASVTHPGEIIANWCVVFKETVA